MEKSYARARIGNGSYVYIRTFGHMVTRTERKMEVHGVTESKKKLRMTSMIGFV